jgi:hypothetical protein
MKAAGAATVWRLDCSGVTPTTIVLRGRKVRFQEFEPSELNPSAFNDARLFRRRDWTSSGNIPQIYLLAS